MKQLNMNDERKETMMKATYTEETFEDYYRTLVEEHCRKEGMTFRLDEWDGARENMRDDAFVWNDDYTETVEPAYTDQDLIDEYLYFCLTDDFEGFSETSDWADNFEHRYLSPDYNSEAMTYEFFAYREGDKPYSHYDTERMDLYRGTYTFDKANCMFHFNNPERIER